MKVIYERCAGLDVHKKTVVACRIGVGEDSQWRRQETHTFKTMTNDILALADWLQAGGVTHVAMESTGAYWKPIYNILESNFEVILVNARHIKHVPGRKTDVKDAEWIAQLLQHGLLKASYIPETPQRALRDLARYRTKLVQERTREINRVQKVLEDANIKLGSVVSDIMGVSAKAMMAAIVSGQDDPQTLAQLAKGRMRPKIAELEQALNGRVADHHRLMLSLHLEHIDDLNIKIERLQQIIDEYITPFNQNREVERLDGIPGVGPRVAQVIIAELGIDMSRFPTSGHAASWAGLAPGKNESAGRNYSAKTMKGNRHLKAMLVQAAHTVARSKDNYLSAQFRRIARRRGKKRAAVAVAHSILVIAYHLLRDGTEYIELGGDYFDKLNKQQIERGLVKRLEQLGHKVILEPALSP
ncbi:MAG: IS110 family transposase [Chloroflexi bacterium]|jgi:transposase|nr:IS110 family transposase [Chloroflexota bacterium]